MMHRHRLLVPAMLVWLGSSATAQEPPGTILSQNFDQGLGTWVVTNPTGGVGWNADSSPGNVAGTGAHVSPPNSLNYNNGTSYSSNNAANQGTAKSPAVSLTGTTNPVLTFQCNYATELNADFDRRTLWIVQGATVVEGHQLIPPPAPGDAPTPIPGSLTCAAVGTWHTHTLPLNPAWGNIQVQFQFETIDEVDNDFAGWFIDDVRITATAPGGTTGGGGEGPNPGARLRDNSNGDKGINDLICPNAVPGSPAASAGLVAFLLAMAASLRRSH